MWCNVCCEQVDAHARHPDTGTDSHAETRNVHARMLFGCPCVRAGVTVVPFTDNNDNNDTNININICMYMCIYIYIYVYM